MTDAAKGEGDTFGELLERAAEVLDRLAAPVYGDTPHFEGHEVTLETQSVCPICRQPMDTHRFSFDVLDRSRYINCPVSTWEQLSY